MGISLYFSGMRLFLGLIALYLTLTSAQSFGQSPADSVRTEKQIFGRQTRQGSWMVGTNFGMGLGYLNESLTFNESIVFLDITFNPKGGYFLKDKWIAGLSYDYYATVSSFGEQNDYSIFSHVIAGYTRYYFPLGFFGEVQAGWGPGRDRYRNGDLREIENFHSLKYSVGAGIGNFWGERVNYEIMLRFSQTENTYRNGQAASLQRFSVVAGVNVSIGK